MRRLLFSTISALICASTTACTSHLVFLESAHMGLKASFEPSSPTPAEVDIGWRRAVFAMIPQKSGEEGGAGGGGVTVKTENQKTKITVVPNPDELMSLYAVHCGNIGFNDPIEIRHFMATGVAATNLLANDETLRDAVGQFDGCGSKQQPPQ